MPWIDGYIKAFLNVSLWKELNSYPKGLPPNICPPIIKINQISYSEAEVIQERVREWFEQDKKFIEQLKSSNQGTDTNYQKEYSSNKYNNSSLLKSEATTVTLKNISQNNTGYLSMKIEGIEMPFNIPFNNKESLTAALNVLNLLANKFDITIFTKETEKKDDESKDKDESSNNAPFYSLTTSPVS